MTGFAAEHWVSYVVVCLVAFLASGLTFFSGFGLGTLLMPVFALFFPLEQAIAFTAVVHFLNGLFKLALVGRHADRGVLFRFGVPAIVAALVGAWLLHWLSELEPLTTYQLFNRYVRVTPVKLVMGLLLLVFALVELIPQVRDYSFGPQYLTLGGVLSGFFGGLSGMQGALRSAFLAKAGLSKEAFIGTGVVIACLIDFSRLGVYTRSFVSTEAQLEYGLLTAAALAAFAGAFLGNRFLKKVTMQGIQRLVALLLFVLAVGLASGLL